MPLRFSAAVLALVALAGAAPARAADPDPFFQSAEGQWVGPGEIVAGKYKGTKFVCTFDGQPRPDRRAIVMDGGCRVGVFTQKMSARVERDGAGYRGTFQDGADGKGLDITGGTLDGSRLTLGINRAQLTGALLAKLSDPDTMTVTISVRVADTMVPVIGVSLKRVDGAPVGAVSAD